MQIIEIWTLKGFERLAQQYGVKTIFAHHSESGMPSGEGRYFFLHQGFLFMFESGSGGGINFEEKGFDVVTAQVFPYYELFELRYKRVMENSQAEQDSQGLIS